MIKALIPLALIATPVLADVRTEVQPRPAQRQMSSIGDTIWTTRLQHFTTTNVVRTTVSLRQSSFIVNKIYIPANSALEPADSRQGYKACTVEMTYYLGDTPGDYMCLFDDDIDGAFDRFGVTRGGAPKKLKEKIPYRRDVLQTTDSKHSKEFRLIYLGKSGDGLRLSYREFANDMARQAFTEELTVPLGATYPQAMVVKGTKFIIHKVDAVGLDYEIAG